MGALVEDPWLKLVECVVDDDGGAVVGRCPSDG